MSGCEFSLCTRSQTPIQPQSASVSLFGKAWLVLTKDSTIPRFNQALYAHSTGGGFAGNQSAIQPETHVDRGMSISLCGCFVGSRWKLMILVIVDPANISGHESNAALWYCLFRYIGSVVLATYDDGQ
jgi:hypothetical protein